MVKVSYLNYHQLLKFSILQLNIALETENY